MAANAVDSLRSGGGAESSGNISSVQIQELRENGLAVIEKFLPESIANQVLTMSQIFNATGKLRSAEMNRGDTKWKAQNIRGDRIVWITSMEKSEVPPIFLQFFDSIRELRRRLQKDLPELSLGNKISIQLAFYPGGTGARYARHCDTFKENESRPHNAKSCRKITALFYLNKGWVEANGGLLRAYMNSMNAADDEETKVLPGTGELVRDVSPLFNRLLLFNSETIEHEVLPCNTERYALTAWMYGTTTPQPIIKKNNLELLKMHVPDFKMYKTLSSPYLVTAGMTMLSPGNLGNERPEMFYDAQPLHWPSAFLPNQERHASARKRQSIFVSIPSYRDPECQHTIRSVFASAEFPDRVFVGVCMQYDRVKDTECFNSGVPLCRPNQVRVMHVDYQDAKGPAWARSMVEKMWNKEDYILQLDSHMRLRPNWDTYLIKALSVCPSKKPIISSYPLAYQLPNQVPADDTCGTLLCASHFDSHGILRTKGRRLKVDLKADRESLGVSELLLPSLFWASGFSFSRSNVLVEVPYDPLPHLFFGEEPIMSVRLWTSGFDFFTTMEAIAYHLWKRDYRATFQELHIDSKRVLVKVASRDKVLRLLTSEDPKEETYGLGTERSLDDYQSFTGVHFRERTLKEKSVLGGQPADAFRSPTHQDLLTLGEKAEPQNDVVPPSTIDDVLALLSARGDL